MSIELIFNNIKNCRVIANNTTKKIKMLINKKIFFDIEYNLIYLMANIFKEVILLCCYCIDLDYYYFFIIKTK